MLAKKLAKLLLAEVLVLVLLDAPVLLETRLRLDNEGNLMGMILLGKKV